MDYLLVCSPESYQVTEDTNVIGFYDNLIEKSCFKEVKQGELVYFYITGTKTIEAVGEITNPYFYDDSMIYGIDKDYVFPHRIKVNILKKNLGIDFKPLVQKLDFIKDKTGRVVYSAYFVRTFIPLSNSDSELMRSVSKLENATV